MDIPLLFDPARAETRVEFGMAEAEYALRSQWRASAEVFRAIDATLREAVAAPALFIDARMLRGDAVEFAQRAVVADLAVRLMLAESTVRDYGFTAAILRERLPLLWGWFTEGDVSTQNAREAAAIAAELAPEFWSEFEARIIGIARTLAPARFRARARAIRERLQKRTLTERHTAAVAERGVWTEADRDGMGWLHAKLSADKLAMVTANLDAIAFGLFTQPDETRTMTQLRADVFTDLLTGAGTSSKVGVTVALTVPVLTLLGHTADPALLEGVGPVDIDTARRLCAGAPSLTRLLTDPATGSILHMDTGQYRVSAALKRWLAITQVTCDFPGCGRRAGACDLDHTIAWADGGTTTAANLAHRCRRHHTLKHHTKWRVERPPGSALTVWTSPTGHRHEADPPPF